jgi:hypothetical protein
LPALGLRPSSASNNGPLGEFAQARKLPQALKLPQNLPMLGNVASDTRSLIILRVLSDGRPAYYLNDKAQQ